MPKATGGGWEEQPHVQGAVAAQAQEGLEELFYVKVRRGGGEEILLVLEKAEDQRSNCQHPLDHGKSKRVPEKHLFLLY